jgi:hypothetical protein
MPLFVAQHRHEPTECPASAGTGSELLTLISAANAGRHGVTIDAEALIDGEHRLILIVQAADVQAVERFLAFLRRFGDLQIMAASTAEEAIRRRGCDREPQITQPDRAG